jgi:hypothetical protein
MATTHVHNHGATGRGRTVDGTQDETVSTLLDWRPTAMGAEVKLEVALGEKVAMLLAVHSCLA